MMPFLIPFTIALVTGYVSQQLTDKELASLFDVASIVTLLLSLMLAPWQLKFLLLLVLIRNFKQD